MFFYGSGALNDRLVEETRALWSYHPTFKDDLVDNIHGKYIFEQRPQRGIVIRTSGGNHTRLTWDNFQATRSSYVARGKVQNKPGLSLEFVREDGRAIQDNGGMFPSPPGVYIIEIVNSELNIEGVPTGFHEFTVSPKLSVVDEGLEMVDPTTGFLEKGRFIPGSLELYEMPSNWRLIEGVNYIADSETGEITLLEELPAGLYISADYRYEGEVTGPFPIQTDMGHFEAIPGVVLGFGRRITPGDQVAVVVQERRDFSELEYGGRVDISVDIDLWARDIDDQREMLDLMLIWYESVLRSRLSTEGIEIMTVGWGGETEEIYDENADDYFYGATLSLTVQTDWMLHVPILGFIRHGSQATVGQLSEVALRSLGPEVLVKAKSNLKLLEKLGLSSFDDPFFQRLDRNFETVR